MSHYVEPEHLSQLLLDAREHGVSEELTRVVDRMILGLWCRCGRGIGLDYDEVRQECWLVLLKLLGHYEAKADAFRYLSYSFRFKIWAMRRQERRHEHLPLEEVLV